MTVDPLNHRALRDALQAQLAAQPWIVRSAGLRLDSERDQIIAAGVIRKALAPQLAEHREALAAIDRVRAVIRQHRADGVIPLRQIEAALSGDEDYMNA